MNENINLCEILKDCLKDTVFYSSVYGEVVFHSIKKTDKFYPIAVVDTTHNNLRYFDKYGRLYYEYDGECVLFPSKDQRDWSKWKCPKPKKPKFDPKTLHPFDRVLIFNNTDKNWTSDFYSYTTEEYVDKFLYVCVGDVADKIIPYNKDTKHLVGTTEEAPEYYRYWED